MADKDVNELRGAIDEISTVAAETLAAIAAIARLALAAMERPQSCGDVEAFAGAFVAILDAADRTDTAIGVLAEDAGFPCINRAQHERLAARCAAAQGRV